MWGKNWRQEIWAGLSDSIWDLIVIGGGITGAGILKEAARLGLRALMLEQNDFASGTSSRSSKLVHGGLRYLRQFQWRLTRASVREREHLLEVGAGLIERLGFLYAAYEGTRPPAWMIATGLTVYDILALRWDHKYLDADSFRELAPDLTAIGLRGGFSYYDAKTDDARLTLRVIREAVRKGATALNYAQVVGLTFRRDGQVGGVIARDRETGQTTNITAKVVINATGAWADELRAQIGARPRLRPLRGSHLIFPAYKLPVAQAITFPHPDDGRPVFVIPWEGATLLGTTDCDHREPLDREPSISPDEVRYLMRALEAHFPALHLRPCDAIATFSGVRPVIGTGKDDPSKESREHAIWDERGLITVTGGKLTTFRLMALDTLKAASAYLSPIPPIRPDHPILDPVGDLAPELEALPPTDRLRLYGRYGAEAAHVIRAAGKGELKHIPGTQALWAEVRWAALAEGVVHLDDLLLRRVRLGLLCPEGGLGLLDRLEPLIRAGTGWDKRRWQQEVERYTGIWHNSYSAPGEGKPLSDILDVA